MSTYQLNYLNFALGFFVLIFYSIKIFSTIIVFLNRSYLNLLHNIIDLNNKLLNLIFSYFESNQFTCISTPHHQLSPMMFPPQAIIDDVTPLPIHPKSSNSYTHQPHTQYNQIDFSFIF